MLKKRVIICLLLLVGGCGEGIVTEERVDDVVRVFWHERYRYSLLYRDNEQVVFKMLPHKHCHYTLGASSPVKIIVDDNSRLWANIKIMTGSWRNPDPCILLLELHIRSVDDISGGAWNHGKFGSGQTHVIY